MWLAFLVSGSLFPGLAVDATAASESSPTADPIGRCHALRTVIGDAPRVEIVISGGSSRGSYQAGQMYMLSNCLREIQATKPALEVTVAGSSAGSINAIALAADLLTNTDPPFAKSPEESIFFRTWVPLGFGEEPWSLDSTLDSFQAGETEASPVTRAQVNAHQALINPDVMLNVARGLGEFVEKNAVKGRKVRVAITAARHVPISDEHGVTMSITETFAFELEGKEVFVLQRGEEERSALSASDGYTAFGRVARLGRASSAIPVGFPLFEMSCAEYRTLAFDAEERGCNDQPIDTSPLFFLDGGALEGNPLRVARDVDANHPVPKGDEAPRSNPPFLYLDPDLRGTTLRAAPPVEHMNERYLQVLVLEGAPTGFLSAARNQSVSLLLAEDLRGSDQVAKSLIVTRHDPYGNYAGGFLALYDRSFRVWDFYAGLSDTAYWLDTSDGGRNDGEGPSIQAVKEKSALASFVMELTAGATPSPIPRAALGATTRSVVRTLPFGVEVQANAEEILDWQARQLLDNLIVLSLVYERRTHVLWDGSLEGLGQELGRVHTLAGEEVRFRSLDLGGGSFAPEFRERAFWQVGQVYKRDALSGSPLMPIGGAMARQALLGRPASLRYVLTSSPLHAGGLWAGGLGIGGSLPWPAGRWSIPLDATLVADFPNAAPQLSAKHLSWGASLELRAGVQLGFGPQPRRMKMMGPPAMFSLAVQPALRGVALLGHPSVGRLPVLVALDPEDPRRYLTAGVTGTITALDLLYATGGLYLSPTASQTCAELESDCRNFALTGEVGVRVPLVMPFSKQQGGRR